MRPLRGVVVCHGGLAEALVDAAESISGVTGVLRCGLQQRLRPRDTGARVAEAVDGQPGGRVRGLAERLLSLRRPQAPADPARASRWSPGVNLAMLVDFVFHRLARRRGRRRACHGGRDRAIRTP